ncbi:MAG: hypothetical protein JO187_14295 [Acidobacteria bacterium]|nr:hypothetical protein [Acidobacteriota bacterium]
MATLLRFKHMRWLSTAYWFNRRPIAWECVVCGKMFAISADEAEHASNLLPPGHIQSAFNMHNCELELAKRVPEPSL